jgi:hypothetical protein
MGQVSLGHDHETGGVAIEPMHDAGPARRPAGQRSAPRDEGVDQGVLPVARGRMNHQPGGLVDHREVLVLEDYGEGDVGRLKRAGGLALREGDFKQIPVGELAGGPGDRPVDPDAMLPDQAGGLSPRQLQLISEKAVEPLGLVGTDGEPEWLGHEKL